MTLGDEAWSATVQHASPTIEQVAELLSKLSYQDMMAFATRLNAQLGNDDDQVHRVASALSVISQNIVIEPKPNLYSGFYVDVQR